MQFVEILPQGCLVHRLGIGERISFQDSFITINETFLEPLPMKSLSSFWMAGISFFAMVSLIMKVFMEVRFRTFNNSFLVLGCIVSICNSCLIIQFIDSVCLCLRDSTGYNYHSN